LVWYDRQFGGEVLSFFPVFLEIFPILGSVLIFKYFQIKQDEKGIQWLLITAVLCIIVTSIFSIRGLIIDPMAVRNAMSGDREKIDIQAIGIAFGDYGFFNAVMLLIPILVYLLTSFRILSFSWLFIFSLIILSLFPIYFGGLTTTFLFAVILFIFSYFRIKNARIAVYLPIILFISSIFIFNNITANIIEIIADQLGESEIKSKLEGIAFTVRFMDYDPETSQSYFASTRLSLSFQSLYSFLENPLLGGGDSGGHAYWFDRLAIFGLIGWWLVFFMFIVNYKYHKARLDEDLFRYYRTIFFAIFIFGLLKGNVLSPEVSATLFFIIPSFLYLVQQKKWRPLMQRSLK
jgi:hypothetical protein